MKEYLLEMLVCPTCKKKLLMEGEEYEKNEIKSGVLTCPKCGKKYPIVDFIPRFVSSDEYVSNFSFEWKIHNKTQLDTRKEKNSENSFTEKLGITKEMLKGKNVLDVGCGMGRYSDVALKLGAEVVGIDLSYAVDSAYSNIGTHPNANFIQADIFALPFKKDVFDVIFSIGVLHHTPSTKEAFKSIVKYLKKGGIIGIWVYSNYDKLHTLTSDLLRKVTTKLPKRILYFLSFFSVPLYYIYKIPFLGYFLRRLVPISMNKKWKWRILDTFDWYSPKYQWKHRYSEVFEWFKEEGLTVIYLGEPPVGITGEKKS